jgi:metallothionein
MHRRVFGDLSLVRASSVATAHPLILLESDRGAVNSNPQTTHLIVRSTEKEKQIPDTKKCANPVRSCTTKDKFCSTQCEAAKGTTAIACKCGHTGCKGDV